MIIIITRTTVVITESRPVAVPLEVSVDKKFTAELNDKSSNLYKSYKTEFKTKLENAYRDLENFLRIDVNGFRNGSVVCNYAVVLKPGSTVDDEIQTYTDDLANIKVLEVMFKPLNKSIVKGYNAIKGKNKCYGVDCGKGYICDSVVGTDVICKHLCATEQYKNYCQNGGTCFLDDRQELPQCRCQWSDTYVYSGDRCDVVNEKLKMSKKYIIAIAGGVGGGVFLILVIAIIVLAVKRNKKRKSKESGMKGDKLSSVSMEDVRLDRMNDSRSSNGFLYRPKAIENQYQTGIPETKYVHGREHRVVKDRRSGDETYFYQPSSNIQPTSRASFRSDDTTSSTHPSVYDYIDTDSKFEIKRPNIRLGNMNRY